MDNTKRGTVRLVLHLSGHFLREADRMAYGSILQPSVRKRALEVYRERASWLPTLALARYESDDEHLDQFDIDERIEVVPLGEYRNRERMLADLRERFRAATAAEIECDGRRIVGVMLYEPDEEDRDLSRAVTVVQCRGRYLPMLIIGKPRTTASQQ